MSHLFGLSDKEKVVSLLRALLARCTETFDSPYVMLMRMELQELINKQSKATMRGCVTEAVRRMTNPVPETKRSSSRSSARATTSDGNGGNQSDEVHFQNVIKSLFMMQQTFDDLNLDTTSLRNVFEPEGSSVQLKRELRGVRKQLQQYVTSVRLRRFRKAKEEMTEIIRLIEKHVETTPLSTEFYAFQFCVHKKNIEASLFYWVAVIFFGKQDSSKTTIGGLRRCAGMLNKINELLMEEDEDNQLIVKEHVIPMMRDLLKIVRDENNVDKKFLFLTEASCCHFLECSEFLVDDWESTVVTLKETLSRMQKVYGEEDVNKVPLYGDLLCHLGCTYCRLSDFDQAIKYHTLSIEAYKRAEGYPTPEARMQQIAECEHNLMLTKLQKLFVTTS